MQYPIETFTSAEQERLRPHFTNLNQPVFALVNLPETVKGALFARYSRYAGTLKQLFLEEFADSLPTSNQGWDNNEGERAAKLYERVFVGYGDDSIAQLGTAHIACEWTSNVLTKILQRGRLASYLEQSTRYIAYDQPMNDTGAYRYYRNSEFEPQYEQAMDAIFAIYTAALPKAQAWLTEQYPQQGEESAAAYQRAIGAKALDLLRGLLPAASLSHVGVFASGQSYEQLILHLLAHPLPEARHYGKMILETIQATIPSFVARVERPERGGRWVSYLQKREQQAAAAVARYGLAKPFDTAEGCSVQLLHVDGDEPLLISGLLFEQSNQSADELYQWAQTLSLAEQAALIAELVGERENRRHRPGRGFEALRYRFEIVSDYGAFRDLQRHRLLTCQWQKLTPELGADVPQEVEASGLGDEYRRALDISQQEYQRLHNAGHPQAASYAVCLGYRIRYVLDLNAREAMHLIELRSGQEGHPSYRAVAHAMHEQIQAVHPAVAAAISHVDTTSEPRLERLLAEIRSEKRSAQLRSS